MQYTIHNSIDIKLDLLSSHIPICVAGDLCYGGKLHHIVVGTVYAGSIPARVVIGKCEGYLLPLKYGEGSYQLVEIYYVESWRFREIVRHLSQTLGIAVKSRTVRLKEGKCVVYCEAIVVDNEACDVETQENVQRKWVRMLLAMPPHAMIVAPPLAVYPLTVDNIEPCPDGQAYCEAPGSSFVIGVHDIYVNVDRLREAFPNNVELKILPAKDPFNKLYCVHTPLKREKL